jgi:hypothetical protein
MVPEVVRHLPDVFAQGKRIKNLSCDTLRQGAQASRL